MQYSPAPKDMGKDPLYETYTTTLQNLNMAFTMAFTIETILKILAFGGRVGIFLSIITTEINNVEF